MSTLQTRRQFLQASALSLVGVEPRERKKPFSISRRVDPSKPSYDPVAERLLLNLLGEGTNR